MFEKIIDEFKHILLTNAWLDDDSKANALKKIKHLKAQVAYPSYYNNSDYIQNNFKVNLLFRKTIIWYWEKSSIEI